MDLSGKLIIKARIGDDIRRIPIHNEDLTFDELVLMMQRVFRGSLTPSDEIIIKYADEDGDLITIFDDSDINFAIQMNRVLKLTIFLQNPKEMRNPQLKNVRKELIAIRNQVNSILDSFDDTIETSSMVNEAGDGDLPKEAEKVESPALTSTMMAAMSIANYDTSFDPLTSTHANSASGAASLTGDDTSSTYGSSFLGSQATPAPSSDNQLSDPPPITNAQIPAAQTYQTQLKQAPTSNQPQLNPAPTPNNSQLNAASNFSSNQQQVPAVNSIQQSLPAEMTSQNNSSGHQQAMSPYTYASTASAYPPQQVSTVATVGGYAQQQHAAISTAASAPTSYAPYNQQPSTYNTQQRPSMPQQQQQQQQQVYGRNQQMQAQNYYQQQPQRGQNQGAYPQQHQQPAPASIQQAPPHQPTAQHPSFQQSPQMMPSPVPAGGAGNPHRLFGSRGGAYRPRQPGPGYQ